MGWWSFDPVGLLWNLLSEDYRPTELSEGPGMAANMRISCCSRVTDDEKFKETENDSMLENGQMMLGYWMRDESSE